ncbi:hypothetical protein BD309DRAFT_1024294 [Dichomitus squalens]|uniref:Uncharacterized protein n=1 Tax=Dichomitus squalens TaxID=114155 RepID=A0A4Q9N6Y3_9APHY|nr:hypothetical protein BD309DRAFT_1024294 [Dichomitus squalens]TBU60041.1 hypothetical protein BD310DRAFT_976190 [Dichomitus squalens]
MAYSNYTGALLDVGGHKVSYNSFAPPPTNLSLYERWTLGPVPVMYATLFAKPLGLATHLGW